MDGPTVSALVTAYLELKLQKDETEAQQEGIKRQLSALIPKLGDGPMVGTWGRVEWVKGRTTTKIDAEFARRELILAGVKLEVVEAAFAKATSTSTSVPSIRISEKGE